MSNLRIIGLTVGIIGFASSFLIYRGPKWNKTNFLFSVLLSFSLIAICVSPNVLNVFRDFLALKEAERGRILALLIGSNIFLWLVILYIKSKFDESKHQFDLLVRSLGIGSVEHVPDSNKKIKPIMVLIPALNEAENLKDILPSMPTEIDDTEVGVLVVDDGSADDTYDVVAQTGYLVVQNRINRGGGAALRMGYDVLAKAGVKICVTMDADGQHQPEEIKKLVLPIIKDQYDFVIGSRILGHREEDSMFRIMGIYTFGFIISRLLGRKITDPSSGFRAFKMDAISSLRLNEDQFHTSELIIEAVKNKIRTGEVPVTILKRKHGETRKGKEWKYGINFARAIIKAWWR